MKLKTIALKAINLKTIGLIGVAVCSIGATQIATASIAVISYSGTFTDFTRPDKFADLDAHAVGSGFSGQIVIPNIDSYANYDRDIREYVFTDDMIDIGSNPGAGFSLVSDLVGGFEGLRSRVADARFDPTMERCSQRNLDRGRCDVFNPAVLRSTGVSYDELFGTANMSIVAGQLDEFTWSGDRSLFSTYDRFFERRGENGETLLGDFRLSQAELTLSDFVLDRVEGEFLYYTANSISSSLTGMDVSAVPVPAAVWLFGSGLLGLVGIARRKSAIANA